MAKTNPTTDHAQVLIHDLILAVQSSLDIAEETARKHYSFSVAELEVSASFDFEMAEQDSDLPEDKPQPKRWFSLFGRGKKDQVSRVRTHDFTEKDSSKLTVRMLFKPGGKLLVSSTPTAAPENSTPPAPEASAAPAPEASSPPPATEEKPAS